MQVQELECQIAQAQMGRYLSGEEMPTDMLEELEGHIAGCDRCREVLQVRRQSLEMLLLEPTPNVEAPPQPKRSKKSVKAAVSVPEETHVPAAFSGKPTQIVPDINLGGEERRETPTDFLRKNAKTLAYSGLLALVLVVMSFFLREPTKLFGERVLPKSESSPVAPAPEAKKAAPEQGAAPKSADPNLNRTADNQPITDQALTAAAGSLSSNPLADVEATQHTSKDSGAVSEFALGAAMSVLSPSPRSPLVAAAPKGAVEKSANSVPRTARKPASGKAASKKGFKKSRFKSNASKTPAIRVYSPAGTPISPNR